MPKSSTTIAWDTATAVAKASEHPGQIATLILPGDTAWKDAGEVVVPRGLVKPRAAPDAARVDQVAKILRSGEPVLIILGNKATRGRALELAGGLRRAPARASARNSSPRGSSAAPGAPRSSASPMRCRRRRRSSPNSASIVTLETKEPVAFFSYPDKPSLLKGPEHHRPHARRA